MSIEMQARLLEEFGADRVRYKPEATRSARGSAPCATARAAGQGLRGHRRIALVDRPPRGIVGTMPGADLIRGIVALWRALEADDERRIYRLSLPISSLVAVQSGLDAFLAVEKLSAGETGVFRNTLVRGRWLHARRGDAREVDRLFDLVTQAWRGG